ncbi:hypothetical protein ACFSNO_27335 [Streptomyces cirratus]
MVWLRYGSLRGRRLSRAAVVVWALTAGTWMVPALHAVAPAGRAVPWPVAVAACAYPLAAALTLAAVASSPRTGPAPVPVAAGTAWGSR